jgi:hypothetical protein
MVQGDAEDLPFETDSKDRYVSAGSIEYWPEPQRGICEVSILQARATVLHGSIHVLPYISAIVCLCQPEKPGRHANSSTTVLLYA